MGSKLAPAYANTFMGKLEKSILNSYPLKPSYYRRFIDDIFIIWPHSETELKKFLTHMNNANESIKFTHEKSLDEITFLDVIVYKKPNKHDNHTLQTRTHIKPTNKQLYVLQDSYHPQGTTKGVTIGEAIRYLRTNSEPDNYQRMLLLHKRNLAKRGYPKTKTNKLLRNIKFQDRKRKALTNKTNKSTIQRPTFTTRYCQSAKTAFRIVHRHWTSISTEVPRLRKFLNNKPTLAYKANPSLSRKLVRARVRNPPENNNTNITNIQHHQLILK